MGFDNLKYVFKEEFRFINECSVCGKTTNELFPCSICEELYCDNCHAIYNQFTQIDYNCCRTCGDNRIGEKWWDD
jgi:hypothetical protein